MQGGPDFYIDYRGCGTYGDTWIVYDYGTNQFYWTTSSSLTPRYLIESGDTFYPQGYQSDRTCLEVPITVRNSFGSGTVSVGGQSYSSPHTEVFFVNVPKNFAAISPQTARCTYTFSSWSDGVQQQSRNVAVGVNQGATTYTANFTIVTPGAPQNLQVYSDQSTGYHPRLTWNANTEPDLAGYTVYRSVDAGIWGTISTVAAPQTSFTDEDLNTNGKPFHSADYKIDAYSTSGCHSPYSTTVFMNFYNWAPKVVLQQETRQQAESEGLAFAVGNYPNPFNPSTTIEFSLPEPSFVRLAVYDVLGQEVAVLVNEERGVSTHRVVWNTRDLRSGIYLYRLETGKFQAMKKILLLR